MSANEKWISALTDKSGKQLLPILEDMRGRGDAVLICNLGGDDQEAQINAYLLKHREGQMADGLALLSQEAGCMEVIIYGGELDSGSLSQALTSRVSVPVTVKNGPASPVLRDETSLYSAIDKGIIRSNFAEAAYKKEYPSYGYQGRPTLIVDGETACQAVRLSADHSAGLTKYVAVIGGDAEMKEVPVGTSAAALLEGKEATEPILLGGTWGSFIKSDKLEQTPISYSYHCDSLRIFEDGYCVIHETAELYRSIKDLSCAKCVLCREGSWQLHAIFSDMTKAKANREDIRLIEDICPLIRVSPLCSFGNNMVLPAMTAVTACAKELTEHVVGRRCRKGQCKDLLSYVIDPSLCTGCGECLDACPEDAIEGKDRFIHIIDEDLCIKCGKCVPACPENAIKFGGEKIRIPKKLVKVGQFR
ncbi:MAG TPA: 4Fe-4S binding protein [Bacillota bacterium]|nr:4Fe-4S binding protein [Bacillota bacterium]